MKYEKESKVSFVSAILDQWARFPFKKFIIDDFREWRGFALLISTWKLASLIKRTTKLPNVGVMLPTSGLFPIALVALRMCGRVVIPINYLLSEEDRSYIIEHAEIDTIITVKPMLDRFGPLPKGIKTLLMEDIKRFFLFKPLSLKRVNSDDLSVILYTSGTSGRPKGVMLTEKNIQSNIDQVLKIAPFNKQHTFVGLLPQFHSFGFTVLTVIPQSIGAVVIYQARFSPQKLIEIFKKWNPNIMVGIPSMYNAILKQRNLDPNLFSNLEYAASGGEPLPHVIREEFEKISSCELHEGYGLTETAPVANWALPPNNKPGTVGKPVPGVKEKIVSSEGEVLGVNEDGEVRIKGDNVMKGYYKDKEATDKVFDQEGYFCTGDMGRIDEDGYLSITGRIKEMLIISGENVFPREIEEILNRHPFVSDSGVIGKKDLMRGEVPIAFVELKEKDIDVDCIRSFCSKNLPSFKRPKEIIVLDSLPRNPTGKILRRELVKKLEYKES